MRVRAGHLGWIAGVGPTVALTLALVAPAARADYCAFRGTSMFGPGGVTVALSPFSGTTGGLASCTVDGAMCGSGGVCRHVATGDPALLCAPLATDPVVWSCSAGCTCPTLGAVVPTHVPVPTSDGVICLCDYAGAATLCSGIGVGDAERFVRCHTRLTTADTGTIDTLVRGDCDGDGYSNGCEGAGGDRCEPCAHPTAMVCAVTVAVPACAADAGSAFTDAGAAFRDASSVDGGTPAGADAGVAGSDSGDTRDFDSGAAPTDPSVGPTFRGAGGCVCGIVAPPRNGRRSLRAAMGALALALVVTRVARRRRRRC